MYDCSVDGCAGTHYAKGLCERHYARQRNNKPLDAGNDRPVKGQPLTLLRALVATDIKECIEWPYGRTQHGYGEATFCGKQMNAHRIMCTLAWGEPPAGAVAAHSCDNPPCVNPNHIRWATYAENTNDAKTRGRMNRHKRLSDETIREIISLRGTMKQVEIAAKYGISKGHVYSIFTGRRRSIDSGVQR